MKLECFIAFAIFLAYSCNNNRINNSLGSNSYSSTLDIQDTLVVLDSLSIPDSTNNTLPTDAVINETVSAYHLPVQIYKTIQNSSQSIRILLTDMESGSLKINVVTSNEDANIRISRIVMPDGSSEGPFGRECKLDVKQRGDYIIIISKSNMASGSPEGPVYITIEK